MTLVGKSGRVGSNSLPHYLLGSFSQSWISLHSNRKAPAIASLFVHLPEYISIQTASSV